MTEQEIIEYLKNNKTKGIAYMFMPKEVGAWVSNHLAESELLCLNRLGNWEVFNVRYLDKYDDTVFALSADYKVNEESKGEWIEYDIEDGQFFEDTRGFYAWHEWSKFMSDNPGFTAFGGWQYADSNTWFMTPKLKIILATNSISYKDSDAIGNYCTTPSAVGCKPAIPVKIRFWERQK